MTYPDAAANVLRGYVYEGVWEKCTERSFQRWVWTLTNLKALFVLACLAVLIAFTQTRAWVLIRYVIYQMKKSVSLDDTKPHPLQHLSQGAAIVQSLPSTADVTSTLRSLLQRTSRVLAAQRSASAESDCSAVSQWFGIFAVLNIGLFVIMGVAIPWFLSEGALGAPIVKSRMTDECLNSVKYEHIHTIMDQLPKTDAIFQQCLDQIGGDCDAQFYLQRPQIRNARLHDCPFPSGICHNGTKPFEITHSNITPYAVGVNSKSRVTMNHRLTCAPVYLESFLFVTPEPPHETFITVQNPDMFDWPWWNLSMSLNTMNGPNSVSNESSGLRMAKEKGPYDLTILPSYFAMAEDVVGNPKLMHANLRRDDGVSFLIIHRAGASNYYKKVEDPFFAAHNRAMSSRNMVVFYPDHEATALGCLEQYQYCVPSASFCTPWGPLSAHSGAIANHPSIEHDLASLAEIYVLFRLLPSAFSIFDYLAMRTEWHGMTPLARSGLRIDMSNFFINPEEQWVTEVDLWFMKSILDAILFVQYGAQFHIKDITPEFPMWLKKEISLCARILFRDGDHTNINWIGFWATTGSTILICLVSYMVESIHKTAMALFQQLTNPRDLHVKLLTIIETLRQFTRGSSRWWSMMGTLDRLTSQWRLVFFFPSFFTRRNWYGSRGHDRSTQASELDDMEPAGSVPHGSNDIERFADIDNTI
jgi:hypothetical protein